MQQFHKGDWVWVAKDLGASMSHFTADCEAIVIGSYADQYGGDDHEEYTLHIKGEGQCSWYYDGQLTLIEKGRLDKLKEWKALAETEHQEKGDLDWIFAHGEDVLKAPHAASIQALANCFGLTNLWGSRGEGITYYGNARRTLKLATPYLEAGNKAGWLAQCGEPRTDAN